MKMIFRRATVKMLSLAFGVFAMAGLNAQAATHTSVNPTDDDDFVTCILDALETCVEAGGSESDIETCLEQAFEDCL